MHEGANAFKRKPVQWVPMNGAFSLEGIEHVVFEALVVPEPSTRLLILTGLLALTGRVALRVGRRGLRRR